ncbi:MAG TPA: hypothetical protein VG742_03250 [Dongiaceae bacterium]|nr:hypothetical protein [Dongiaceae bacterium]
MLKMRHFPFFGHGMAHGDTTISVTFADMIKHSAQALIGRREQAHATSPAEDRALIEAGHERAEDPLSFPPPSHQTSRLPSDSPLRADIGLLPLDNF